MMRRAIGVALAGLLLVAAAPVKLAPADDKEAPFGAAARAKSGPEPLAKPSEDIGMAEDSPGSSVPGQQPAPPPHAVTAPKAAALNQ